MSENKGKVIFFTTISPSEEDRLQAMLRIALIASSLGYEVFIYLALYSVMIIKRSVFEKLSEGVRNMLIDAMRKNVRIMACKVAMESFNVKEGDIISGVIVAEPGDLLNIAKNAITLSW